MKNKSISIFTNYPRICDEASKNEVIFNSFKSIPEYTQILEHVTPEFGRDYLDIIRRDNPHLLEDRYLNKFKENDKIGGSYIHDYDGIEISPSTLRYVKVLSDIIKIFGDLTNCRIAEIGGGYGGQCKIIQDYYTLDEYHIIDLEPVNRLSEKYLKKLNVTNVKFFDSESIIKQDYDLIISNYAYTELDRDLQDLYKLNILDNSNNGYITCNFINGFIPSAVFPTYTKYELLKLNDMVEIMEEEPLTAPTNFILIWKK